MSVSFSAAVTKDGATLALKRTTKSIDGGAIARRAAHTMVHEFMPDVFYSNLYGWKKTVRPGMPLLDTGTHLASAFVYSVSGAVATIKNLFRYAHIHDKGATIRAKGKKPLRFKIRGVGWFSAREVTIPARRFMYWSAQAKAAVMRSVNSMIAASLRGRA